MVKYVFGIGIRITSDISRKWYRNESQARY